MKLIRNVLSEISRLKAVFKQLLDKQHVMEILDSSWIILRGRSFGWVLSQTIICNKFLWVIIWSDINTFYFFLFLIFRRFVDNCLWF
ncbi:hypothetical protein RhiirB3_533398 [Rhizophagus irregularis]|nr:hypothetical protein RhiirB3_533398 [Rhizophagus irregularis]